MRGGEEEGMRKERKGVEIEEHVEGERRRKSSMREEAMRERSAGKWIRATKRTWGVIS